MEKAIIYNRTSTTDQNPELQLKDCENYCKERNWEIIDRLEEKESAFKDDSKRKIFISMIERAKKREFNHIVVWNMDRFSRQPEDEVLKLTQMLSVIYSVKIHAVNGDLWAEMIETMGRLKEMGFIGEAILEFLEKLIKGLEFQRAYRESLVKSQRVKAATRIRKDGVYSYKGNKWGRKQVSTFKKNKIKKLIGKKSIREIARELNLSKSVVHKYIKESKKKKEEF